MKTKREYLPPARIDKSHKGYVTGGPNTRNFVMADPAELLRLGEACIIAARRLQEGTIRSVRLYTPVYERKRSKPAGYVSVSFLPVVKGVQVTQHVPFAAPKTLSI